MDVRKAAILQTMDMIYYAIVKYEVRLAPIPKYDGRYYLTAKIGG